MTDHHAALRRMRPRRPDEEHRAASPLELFFDLVFVVAVSFASDELHGMEGSGHVGAGVVGYVMVFFAIWWAWMNFTWFATSFDTDDWLYRVTTIVQMAGVLVLAAGVADAVRHEDFTLATIGYVIMRLALVGQWVRASVSHPGLRPTTVRYAIGIVIVQIAWIARLWLPPEAGFVGFVVLALAEMSVPVWAERHGTTSWNARHIAERYSLFILILLGEAVLACTNVVVEALHEGDRVGPLLLVAASGLVTAAAMWWVAFSRENEHHMRSARTSFAFGYFHAVIFAAAGAFPAGVELAVGVVGGGWSPAVAAALAVPVGVFFLSLWTLTLRPLLSRGADVLYLVGVAVIGLSVLTGAAAPIAVALGGVLAVVAVELPSAEAPSAEAPSVERRP